MNDLQAKSTNTLALCPFCGGEAEICHVTQLWEPRDAYWVKCKNCRISGTHHTTEAEAIAAWNSRAPIEYEGWFYLPKPKKGIVQYGEPYTEKVENGYKIKQPVEVIESAIRSWGDELGEYVMKRICEAWNSRAERTCKFVSSKGSDYPPVCSACGYELGIYDCEWFEDGTYGYATDEHKGHWLTGEEIVRCRDCRFSLAHGNGCGRNQDIYDVEPDGFCAWGERRTNDN